MVVLIVAATGFVVAGYALLAVRRCRVQMEQAREEFQILMRQQQTECRDGLGEVNRSVSFLEQSAQTIEDAVKGRLTNGSRSRAMQMLRAGMPPDKAAVALGMGKCEMRLIAQVSRILSTQ